MSPDSDVYVEQARVAASFFETPHAPARTMHSAEVWINTQSICDTIQFCTQWHRIDTNKYIHPLDAAWQGSNFGQVQPIDRPESTRYLRWRKTYKLIAFLMRMGDI